MGANKEHVEKSEQSLPPSAGNHKRGIVPKTDFGRELLELRRKAIADGLEVRGADDILAEIEESRRS